MILQDVTLAPDDIEWVRPARSAEDIAEFKETLFDDGLFEARVAELGVDDAVRAYTKFHRIVANQLIENAVDDTGLSNWAARTVALCMRAKKRRQQVRKMLRDRDGISAADAAIRALDEEFPRAEWGVAA